MATVTSAYLTNGKIEMGKFELHGELKAPVAVRDIEQLEGGKRTMVLALDPKLLKKLPPGATSDFFYNGKLAVSSGETLLI
jgi:hypothetical protein